MGCYNIILLISEIAVREKTLKLHQLNCFRPHRALFKSYFNSTT